MDRVAIIAALGIDSASTDAAIVTAINSMKTKAAAPDPTLFVPKADLDQALNRATTAEATLNEFSKAAAEGKATALIDQAVKDGKIAPASKDHYLALCRAEGGYEQVENLLKTLPKLTGAPVLDAKTPGQDTGGLSPEQKALCSQLGITEEDFAKNLTDDAAL